MRIEFANADRPAIDWNRRVLRIGSADDNDLVLQGEGVCAHHLQLVHDARGCVLEVEPAAGRVYLNARLVRERALVRAGDSLGIGAHRLRLCKEPAGPDAEPIGAASLRVVAGPFSGRARRIESCLDLAHGDPWPLGLGLAPDAVLSLIRRESSIHLLCRHLPETLRPTLNGGPADDHPLRDGDQIALGPHRFVLEACPARDASAEAAPGDDLPDPENSAGPRREVWWLIFTAALLALLISLLFLL